MLVGQGQVVVVVGDPVVLMVDDPGRDGHGADDRGSLVRG